MRGRRMFFLSVNLRCVVCEWVYWQAHWYVCKVPRMCFKGKMASPLRAIHSIWDCSIENRYISL